MIAAKLEGMRFEKEIECYQEYRKQRVKLGYLF